MSFNFLDKTGLSYVIDKIKSKLSPVALSGDYEDLSNLPFLVSGNYYGTSTGQAALQNKAVVVSANQHFELKVGCIVAVKFDANNTYNATASASVTLNVNNTGAKQIYYNNSATPTGTGTAIFGLQNRVIYYMYDGTYWVWLNVGYLSSYGVMSVAELTTGTATASRVVRADYLKQGIEDIIDSNTHSIPSGGTTGQVLKKKSNTDYDTEWANESGGSVTLSHVGQIIHSTTLNTLAKVQAIYGSNTTWISLSGYVLRGATSGVTPNNNAKDLGSDTHTITESELPSHTHSIPALSGTATSKGAHTHKVHASTGTTGSASVVNWANNGKAAGIEMTDSAGAHTHPVTTNASTTGAKGSGTAMSIVPNEKNVYMWERVS